MNEPQNSLAGLLNQVLAEQVKQTAILERIATQQTQLITALADDADGDEPDPDAIPHTYLSGKRI